MERWHLLRVWHTEAMESVLQQPGGYVFARTSYAAAPAKWRELDEAELSRRVRILLDAHYAKHNAQMATADDPNRMMLVAFDLEWVDRAARPADAQPNVDAFVAALEAHMGVLERAVAALRAFRAAPRDGLDAKVWQGSFGAWRVDENDTWHLVKYTEREAMFAERFGS